MKKINVVLVEDNPKDALIFLRIFKKEGLTDSVIWLKDGEEAVNRLIVEEIWLPKVILLDMKLPKLTGIEVLSKIRKHPKISKTPVVMFSSSDEIIDIQNAYREGANAYSIKPQNYQETKVVIKNIVNFWVKNNKITYE